MNLFTHAQNKQSKLMRHGKIALIGRLFSKANCYFNSTLLKFNFENHCDKFSKCRSSETKWAYKKIVSRHCQIIIEGD